MAEAGGDRCPLRLPLRLRFTARKRVRRAR
jgi:hypothetical protein